MKWDKSDSSKFRDYLNKTDGKIFKYLNSRMPKCDGSTIEQVALQAKFKEGYESATKDLIDLLIEEDDANDASDGKFTSM